MWDADFSERVYIGFIIKVLYILANHSGPCRYVIHADYNESCNNNNKYLCKVSNKDIRISKICDGEFMFISSCSNNYAV